MSNITEIDILEEAKENFLTYTEEVLTDRAVPAAEDGLLSVHRKLLWTMEILLKMTSKTKYKKCASLVGSTLASSYYHGDASCYGALCKLAQPYLMRYPLIDGEGNLGTQEGNGLEAASRYCVAGETLIPTEKGLFPIGDLAKDVPLNSEGDFFTQVRGRNGKLTRTVKIVNSGIHPVYRILLENGQSIKATANHPILTLNKYLDPKWKKVEELKVNSRVLFPVFAENNNFGDYNDLDEAAMLGTFLGAGWLYKKKGFVINELETYEPIFAVQRWISKTFEKDEPLYLYDHYYQRNRMFYVQDSEVREYLAKEYGLDCMIKDRELPKRVFTATKAYQATLLKYLFTCHGEIKYIGSTITVRFVSLSKKLIEQIQLILQMNFGILSTIKESEDHYFLNIEPLHLKRFRKQIGVFSKKKSKNLKIAIKRVESSQTGILLDSLMKIPETATLLKNRYNLGDTTNYNLINLAKIQGKIEKEEYYYIKHLMLNYCTMKIIQITELPPEPVYCFTINDNIHAFIGNGFINHNTNAKPSKYADLMMGDFSKKVVPLKETYNGEYMEPVVLPSLLPNAIVNGRETIAVGLAHNSLPNNLRETCDAIIARIKKGSPLTIDELMEYMKGPDFPLKNTIINSKDIKEAYRTGRSKVSLKVRGQYHIEKNCIVFDTIPYRTYRNKIKEQILKNAEELDNYIEDFSDESNVGINRLVFKLKRGIEPTQAAEALFALTDLQTSLSYNMNYIVNGTPKMCSMMDLIDAYVQHQIQVLIKATEYDKEKAEARKHILEGLLLILTNIDEAIKLIKSSKDKVEALNKLTSNFVLDEIQAEAVLNMKLSSLTKLDKDTLLKELKEKIAIIERCCNILEKEDFRNNVLIEKITLLKNKYGDDRRTELTQIDIKPEEKIIEEVIPEDVVVILSQTGDIKRVPVSSFKVQRKNGKGVKTKDDAILSTISTNTIDNLLLFSRKGKMFKMIVDDVPVGTNSSKGINVNTLIKIDADDEIIAITSLARSSTAKYVVFFTKKGLMKKTLLEEYTKIKRGTGIAAIKINEGDSIVNVEFLNEEQILVITKKGMAIRFESKLVNSVGRIAAGVKTIKLDDGDELIAGLPITSETDEVGIISTKGYGKKTSIKEFTIQGRAGKGIVIYKPTMVYGEIAIATIIKPTDNILLIGKPNSICISATELPLLSRTSFGNIMIKSNIQSGVKF